MSQEWRDLLMILVGSLSLAVTQVVYQTTEGLPLWGQHAVGVTVSLVAMVAGIGLIDLLDAAMSGEADDVK